MGGNYGAAARKLQLDRIASIEAGAIVETQEGRLATVVRLAANGMAWVTPIEESLTGEVVPSGDSRQVRLVSLGVVPTPADVVAKREAIKQDWSPSTRQTRHVGYVEERRVEAAKIPHGWDNVAARRLV